METLTFKATTVSGQIMTNPANHVLFETVVDNSLNAQYDPNTGTLVIPRSGTYALSVKLMPAPGYGAGYSPVADCEIVVDGVETPVVMNEKKTCARVVLNLDSSKGVWVECCEEMAFKATTDLLTKNADNHLLFPTVVDNTLDAPYDTLTLGIPRFGTYALSVNFPSNVAAGVKYVTYCEIVVDGVETACLERNKKLRPVSF